EETLHPSQRYVILPGRQDHRDVRQCPARRRNVMADVTIRVLKNGPYEVTGGAAVTDQKKNQYTGQGDPIYLCRCGQSANKPFCDGTHTKVGFKAEETAS